MTEGSSPRPLADAADRDAIRSALDETLLVEAAAGTGKTTSLVERMVALVREGARVDEIAAVTFTIKAAAELDERFQVALERAARGETDPRHRARFDVALAHLDSCFVGTIHAFCARLLRERPVEAGLEPGFAEMDEAADRSERAAAWRRFGERLFLEENPTLEKIVGLGIPWTDLEPTFHDLCENEDVEPIAGRETPVPDLSFARVRVEEYLDARAGEIPAAVPSAGWDKLQGGIRKADRLPRGRWRSGTSTSASSRTSSLPPCATGANISTRSFFRSSGPRSTSTGCRGAKADVPAFRTS